MGLEGDCADQREAKTSQCDVFKESAHLHLVTRTPQQTSSIFLQPTAIYLQLHPKNRIRKPFLGVSGSVLFFFIYIKIQLNTVKIWVRYVSKKALKHITSEIILGFSIFIYFHFEGFAKISYAAIPVVRRKDEFL